MKPLNDLLKNSKFWHMDRERTKVAPFAGRYPTRWRVQWQAISGETIDYIVKPSSLALAALNKQGKSGRMAYLRVWEFDRLGPFQKAESGMPQKVSGLPTTRHAEVVALTYYPLNALERFFRPWRDGVVPRQLLVNKRILTAYFPKGAGPEAAFLRGHKQWLKDHLSA